MKAAKLTFQRDYNTSKTATVKKLSRLASQRFEHWQVLVNGTFLQELRSNNSTISSLLWRMMRPTSTR
jgi:hypothetical protein